MSHFRVTACLILNASRVPPTPLSFKEVRRMVVVVVVVAVVVVVVVVVGVVVVAVFFSGSRS